MYTNYGEPKHYKKKGEKLGPVQDRDLTCWSILYLRQQGQKEHFVSQMRYHPKKEVKNTR